MMKRKQPCLVIFSPLTYAFLFLCPILGCVASKYPPIFSLNDTECRSFIEAVIIPWLSSEFMVRSSVDQFKLSEFLVKPLENQILVNI
jgi:hypothetical protein